MSNSAVRLSIIIVNWNTKELLRQCIESIYQSINHDDFEVIVVDNASTDGSTEMVKHTFPRIKLIQNKSNMGFAAANNQGLQICSGELILLLNSDTQVLNGALDKCVDYMKLHGKVGALGCRVLYPDGTFQSSYFRFERLRDLAYHHCLGFSTWIRLLCRLGFKTLNLPSRYWGQVFTAEKQVDAVAGCFLLTRRSVIDAVGPLDEAFFFYGEEEEWCFRVKRAGWAIMYFPFAEIIHIHGASSKMLSMSLSLAGAKARLLVLEKTRGFLTAWLGNLIMTLGMLPRVPMWFIADFRTSQRQRKRHKTFSTRLQLARFHLTAMLRPVWRPLPRSDE
jgi:GT2 family glycosyltransferase